jgi:ribosomal protein S27AE
MINAGLFGKLLSAISSFGNEKTASGTAATTSVDSTNYVQENSMADGTHTEFVTRNSTHFCPKCGWCADIEVTMEKQSRTDQFGKTDTSYYYIKTDKKPECPKCNQRSALPLTVGNMPVAVRYLLQSLQ